MEALKSSLEEAEKKLTRVQAEVDDLRMVCHHLLAKVDELTFVKDLWLGMMGK